MAFQTTPHLRCARILPPHRRDPRLDRGVLRSLRGARVRLAEGRMTWCVEAYFNGDGSLSCVCYAPGFEPPGLPRPPPPKPAPYAHSVAAFFDALTPPRRRRVAR
jgi:hypothetical protein